MRNILIFTVVFGIVASIVSYCAGYNSGKKVSPLEEDRRGLIIFTVNEYRAAEATNWTRVQTFLNMTLLAATRDYEKSFGIPSGTNPFAGRFAEAKTISDQIEKGLVPLESAFGSNVTVRVTK